eukprot:1863683-Rhodomonas_salina.1
MLCVVGVGIDTEVAAAALLQHVPASDLKRVCKGAIRQRLHEDLHSTAQAQHQMQRRFLLDVVVR